MRRLEPSFASYLEELRAYGRWFISEPHQSEILVLACRRCLNQGPRRSALLLFSVAGVTEAGMRADVDLHEAYDEQRASGLEYLRATGRVWGQ